MRQYGSGRDGGGCAAQVTNPLNEAAMRSVLSSTVGTTRGGGLAVFTRKHNHIRHMTQEPFLSMLDVRDEV